MNLTDEQLREALHSRAARLSPPLDVFAGVEKRAHRMQMNRRGGAILGAAAAVAAVAVIVPIVVGGSGRQGAPVVGPSPTTATQPTPTQPTQPTPTAPPTTPTPATPSAQGVLDPAHPWAYRGDQKVAAGSTLAAFTAAWQAKHPGATLTPLYGEIYEVSAQPEMVFLSTGPDGPRWGYGMGSRDGVNILVDEPLSSSAMVLAAAVPGDEVSRLLAVAAPTTKVIRYAPDGTTFANIAMLAPGVGVYPLEGDPGVDRIQLVDANGTIVYQGSAPDHARPPTGPSSGVMPTNVVPWAWRGTHFTELTDAVGREYEQSRNASGSEEHGLFLYGGADAAGTQYVLTQAWLPGDSLADTVALVRHTDGKDELQILRRLNADSPVAVIDVTDSPAAPMENLVVIPRSASDRVYYAADGATFKAQTSPALDGVVTIARDPHAAHDKIRVVDVTGATTFEGSAASLLCGVTSCG